MKREVKEKVDRQFMNWGLVLVVGGAILGIVGLAISEANDVGILLAVIGGFLVFIGFLVWAPWSD
ncbi:hypothetical protein [Horticoccus sp. 23ND18S-11]|uniref:hypothetical protein n=1 Tax=Horticoccus sp. 23ND18S-11 TaxID=3391832 RepID=UPI0039C97802